MRHRIPPATGPPRGHSARGFVQSFDGAPPCVSARAIARMSSGVDAYPRLHSRRSHKGESAALGGYGNSLDHMQLRKIMGPWVLVSVVRFHSLVALSFRGSLGMHRLSQLIFEKANKRTRGGLARVVSTWKSHVHTQTHTRSCLRTHTSTHERATNVVSEGPQACARPHALAHAKPVSMMSTLGIRLADARPCVCARGIARMWPGAHGDPRRPSRRSHKGESEALGRM